MDQEKFDQHLMDYLFDELDEVTAAAMKRKIESDADCRDLEAGLRATLELTGRMPLEEPDEDLEERILAAASLAQEREPWTRKLMRSLSWAGSHAMRPQLAMAAILMLVLGSSILLLRARPGSVAVTPVKEDGPAATAEAAAESPALANAEPVAVAQLAPEESAPADEAAASASAEPAPAADEDGEAALEVAQLDQQYDRAIGNYRAGNYLDAQRDFAQVNQSKSAKAPSAALYEARAVRAQSGCQAAVAYYGRVRARFSGSAAAADATFEEADCQRQLGQASEATQLLMSLRSNSDYTERVEAELNNQGQAATSGGQAVASQRRASAKESGPAAPPKPAPPAKPAPSGGSSGKGKVAAPDDAYDNEAY